MLTQDRITISSGYAIPVQVFRGWLRADGAILHPDPIPSRNWTVRGLLRGTASLRRGVARDSRRGKPVFRPGAGRDAARAQRPCWRAALIVWLMGLALIGSEYPLSAALLLVEWRENLLTVSAENVPMAQVLDSISRETGVVIEGLEAAGSPVSVRFAGLPLYEALEELQRGQPYVLVEAPLEGATSPRFIVSPAGAGPAPDAGDAPNESGEAQAIRKPDMQAPDPKARIAALEAAMQVGGEGPETDAALVAALNDGDATVRRYAYERLRERGDARAADALIEAAAGGQVEVRAMLLRDLPNVDDARVFAVLRDATEDENPEIRGTAFETLAGGGQRAAEVLRERLLHPDPEMRMLALMALAAHGPELAREGAYALYNDEDERVKSQVEGLLAELDELRTRQSSARSSW